ncbi:MAG: hypothetical protein IJU01_05430 [Lachnospiraceae bacterium]|nr:hypothetical protein [Lachnospiraceae bacterium]
MPNWLTVIFIVLAAVAVVLVVLYFVGRKLQRRQGEQAQAIENAKQVISMLIIDKKKLKAAESGLPKVAVDSIPKYLRWNKLPIVKARVGARVMNLVADKSVFDALPVGKEVKVEISGIYITGIKSVRGGSIEPTKKQKKAREKEKAKAEKVKTK